MDKVVKFTAFVAKKAFPNLEKNLYNTSNFRKYGLMIDDMIRMDTDETKEAKSRLSTDLAAERQFRISRAMTLNASNQFLPKEEWMTPEKDVPYLRDLIREVQAEKRERLEYEAEFYSFKSGQAKDDC
ncbi:uncharacterized protein LOC132715255 [Ruditapes philippinarum]|uniref:uncharacterized protein LOC132715255 n=1 Tax=Ruditapes philippinarum TaxID=129788 RepID=UPI00295BF93B|nr:uncharacterized protein LOC132715255 [Ruditapes philippinarum]